MTSLSEAVLSPHSKQSYKLRIYNIVRSLGTRSLAGTQQEEEKNRSKNKPTDGERASEIYHVYAE